MSEAARQNLIDRLTSFGVSFSESWSNETLQILLDAEIAKLERIDRETKEAFELALRAEELKAIRENAELLLNKTSDNQDAIRFFLELEKEQKLKEQILVEEAEILRQEQILAAEAALFEQQKADLQLAIAAAEGERAAILKLTGQDLLSQLDTDIINTEVSIEREKILGELAALSGNFAAIGIRAKRLVALMAGFVELLIQKAEEEERQRLLDQVKVEGANTQTVNDNFFSFLDPLGRAISGLTGAFLSLVVPSPLEIAQNARNQVDAVKILLDSKIINHDIEAFNVEKIQKEIAGG